MKTLVLLLTVSSISFADNVAYLGTDNNGNVVQKAVSVNDDGSLGTRLSLKFPSLTWRMVKEGDKDYDAPMSSLPTLREQYQSAGTAAERLAIIAKALGLN